MRSISLILAILFLLVSECVAFAANDITVDDLLEYSHSRYSLASELTNNSNDNTELSEAAKQSLGTKEFLRDTGAGYLGLWAVRFFYVRNKNSRIFNTSLSDWWDNITKWPEWDDGDSTFTNFVVHPIIGAQYYLWYRTLGHDEWVSALGSVLMSTLFEYTVEGIVETPSMKDLIFTPLIGAPMGFVFYEASDWLVETDFVPAKIAGHIVNPMRNFIKDRQFGVYNPLAKSFMSISGPIDFTPNKSEAIMLSYPLFFEEPIPIGRATADLEVVNLKRSLDHGEFIFYSVRVDLPSKNTLWGLYVQIQQAGVNSVVIGEEVINDGFEFANLLIGGKHMLAKSRNFVLTAGTDLILPTAYKDNIDRLQTVILFRRNYPLHLKGATTFSPYLSGAVWKNFLSLQANVGTDWVFNARNLEGNNFEFRLKYHAAVGANIPIPTSPVLFAEFNGYSQLTADTFGKNDYFFTSGIRLWKKYSPGFAVQLPMSGPSTDVARISYLFDFQLRF